MEIADARALAHQAHIGQRNRHGDLFTEHLERVAASVPPEAMTVAFLHDVIEHSDLTLDELAPHGLTPEERAALVLLTREPDETFEAQSLRIAFDRGPGGRIARMVKLADLDDHISSRKVGGAPPYGWARMHVTTCQDRYDRPEITAA
jgi:hypothetical protein